MADKKAKAFFKIVIPNYNNIAYVGKCLDSVFQQTFRDFFVVFVDDQSTDFSYELAESYERRFPDKMAVMRAGTKCYAGGCRNIGIDYPVECEYVYFIDSDDYLYSDISLRKIYDALNEKPDMLLIGWCQDINGKIFTNSKYCVFDPNSDNLASTIWSASWARVTRRSVTMKFLENCMRAEDTYQFLRILDTRPSVKQIDDPVYVYRYNPNGAIHSGIFEQHRPIYIKALTELRRACRNANVIRSIDKRLGLN